ncbi:uncharacterized protein B0H18DRAFT_616617 [Fomitopsis serialis]|uniref:uncharacterized protein n=1 Tax=Fomitopsis serialis TaxID=139415 RepID=UPI0020087794|nr:uncharacterized protein B0H18DRAFT_616617 [Neoantrodia serialis]KAH9920061.1 hypothetical protein B0H18DRAFT_616617 [Neoantrodia serialis]
MLYILGSTTTRAIAQRSRERHKRDMVLDSPCVKEALQNENEHCVRRYNAGCCAHAIAGKPEAGDSYRDGSQARVRATAATPCLSLTQGVVARASRPAQTQRSREAPSRPSRTLRTAVNASSRCMGRSRTSHQARVGLRVEALRCVRSDIGGVVPARGRGRGLRAEFGDEKPPRRLPLGGVGQSTIWLANGAGSGAACDGAILSQEREHGTGPRGVCPLWD